ncbi:MULTISPECIES: hypothetical protein [unclassified Ectothiorhodospira]|uniref:hypothetical protein n=1 Tax=unclassified Ectothiorhodospira TaxID=2684909 RepID=UPI001EE8CA30|nr:MULTISPECIES: hypothetical protein [unclassified Ectothiorhodospira]MCG5516384.1 hypothetical protein [Ectothiorhodospira sp. 9100]MCG5519366.1 hypothetical protein [Ectothiorhodospira sp. 9905]
MTHHQSLFQALSPAFEAIPEEVAHHGTAPPEPATVYVVPGHESALNPDTAVVVGDRGTGKSFWSSALNSEATRLVIGQQLKRLRLENTRVGWGYSSETSNRNHPSRRVLQWLLERHSNPEDIWRTAILHRLLENSGNAFFQGAEDWPARIQRVADNPEMGERLFASFNDDLEARGERYLLVFDALDRLGSDWAQIRTLLRGLLRVGLDLREYRAIRTKFFLRQDMWEDSSLWAFPDASKLTHGRVLLQWHRADLYALLWHHLANHAGAGPAFREWVEREYADAFARITTHGTTVYVVPESLRTQETHQATLLQVIASRFMGPNRRRGNTFTWLPTHLADAKGQVSPRSFLVALKQAHAVTQRHYPQADVLLHYEGIKKGVQEASRLRLRELQEDYPWIQQVLEPLRGMTVPAHADELHDRWRDSGVVNNLLQAAADNSQSQEDSERPYLPPHGLEQQAQEETLTQVLIGIGVINRTADARLNMPDLFRVAAGIGRRGGVRPIR